MLVVMGNNSYAKNSIRTLPPLAFLSLTLLSSALIYSKFEGDYIESIYCVKRQHMLFFSINFLHSLTFCEEPIFFMRSFLLFEM